MLILCRWGTWLKLKVGCVVCALAHAGPGCARATVVSYGCHPSCPGNSMLHHVAACGADDNSSTEFSVFRAAYVLPSCSYSMLSACIRDITPRNIQDKSAHACLCGARHVTRPLVSRLVPCLWGWHVVYVLGCVTLRDRVYLLCGRCTSTPLACRACAHGGVRHASPCASTGFVTRRSNNFRNIHNQLNKKCRQYLSSLASCLRIVKASGGNAMPLLSVKQQQGQYLLQY